MEGCEKCGRIDLGGGSMNDWINVGHWSLIWLAEIWAVTANGVEQHYYIVSGAMCPGAPWAVCFVL